MRTPSPPKETEEQRIQRVRAEQDNIRSIQDTVQRRTAFFQRRMSPRISIATGARTSSLGMI